MVAEKKTRRGTRHKVWRLATLDQNLNTIHPVLIKSLSGTSVDTVSRNHFQKRSKPYVQSRVYTTCRARKARAVFTTYKLPGQARVDESLVSSWALLENRTQHMNYFFVQVPRACHPLYRGNCPPGPINCSGYSH